MLDDVAGLDGASLTLADPEIALRVDGERDLVDLGAVRTANADCAAGLLAVGSPAPAPEQAAMVSARPRR